MHKSRTGLLHFNLPILPKEVRVGYPQFKVKQYITKPLRCFKCNRYGHVAKNCKGKEQCSNCGGEHNWKSCDYSNKICPNCKGNHCATDKKFPHCKKQSKLCEIKTTSNVFYSEVCKKIGILQHLLLPV